jgi:8-amino-3,8-dideoxy-alpha-D-manno-octulosonate transaminase
MSELTAAIVRVQLRKLDTIVGHMRASKYRIQAAIGNPRGLAWRRVEDPAGDSGPFMIAMLADAGAATRLASAATARGLNCTRLQDYGLHVYSNVRALVEKRSHSADGFPWTHPANRPLVRDYRFGALPRTDALMARSVILPVPSNLTTDDEDAYAAALRDASAAAGLA